jgi:hypothetical protein
MNKLSTLFYKQISLFTYSFILIQLLLVGFIYYLNPGINNKAISELLQWLVPVVSFGGIITSNSIFSFKLRELQSNDEKIEEKQKHYLTATIIRLALLAGPSLLALLSFLFTSNHVFLGFNVLIIIIMVLQKPSEIQINLDLEERIFSKEEHEIKDIQQDSFVKQLAEELHLNHDINEEKKEKILKKHLIHF